MSGYQTSCPACGATLVFQLGSTLLRVCDQCGVAVARKGADLANYGRVAELIPTPSVLKLGLEGGYAGAPRFTLVGRLQLDYGAGTWDEWLMGFGNGTWSWLSEAQGRFHYMGQVPLPPVPAFDQLQVGQTLDLGPPGVFVVAEVRTARFMTMTGELPFDLKPGSLLYYADLSGPGGQFATLDYGSGAGPEALYVGREITLAELGFKDLPDEESRRKKAVAQKLSCPKCGGPLEVRAPDATQRVACPYCGSLLDATKDFAVLSALDGVRVKPLIPLGTSGRIGDATWQVIGFMVRSTQVEGVRYAWREYLLYEARRGFRWLVEANGHWSFVEPANAGDVRERLGRMQYRDLSFRHFQSGIARVDEVIGEFYWAVETGASNETADYVCPPHMLSMERDAAEINWSFGTYLAPEDVWKAFRLKGTPPTPSGIGPHQPSPWAGRARGVYLAALLSLGLTFLLFLMFAISGGKPVFKDHVAIPATAVPGAPESAVFAGPFIVSDQGNLEIRVSAPVNNSWLYVSGALINDETGGVDDFDVEVAYYNGSDSDGAWSEGSTAGEAYVASVPPGRYTLRLEPQWEAGKSPGGYDVSARGRVARFHQALLAMLALGVWPLLMAWRQMRFEMQRWSESDHPWVSQGGDDDE